MEQPTTHTELLIAGGGIGGLALALAARRAGVATRVLEQAPALAEVGAGIQLGPNAVRVLAEWGLMDALRAVAAFPEALSIRDAYDGRELGRLRLGQDMVRRYGQPYATIHRADAHALLWKAVQALGDIDIRLGQRVHDIQDDSTHVTIHTMQHQTHQAHALVGCDGLWSMVRPYVLDHPSPRLPDQARAAPRFSGHLAYRGLVDMAHVPNALQAPIVTVWLGPKLHVVHYPVSSGRQFNVVAVVHGHIKAHDAPNWSHQADRSHLLQAVGPVYSGLTAMLDAAPHWRLWPLNDRPPMHSAAEHARGRVALLGDAAHPMRPYLAQGAAMAIEDAWTLGQLLHIQKQIQPQTPPQNDHAAPSIDWATLFQRYAQHRWARNAQVQRRAIRNGTIFHSDGWLEQGRNWAMALLGERLLDQPWLYAGPPKV
jgi:salicylate hydroxylase